MVQIIHRTLSDLPGALGHRLVPCSSLAGEAEGAFLFLYDHSDGGSIFGYYKPETIFAGGNKEDYQVVTDATGAAISCDCPSMSYRKDGKTCKHVDTFNEQREARAAVATGCAAPDGKAVATITATAVPMTTVPERGTPEYAAYVADLTAAWN